MQVCKGVRIVVVVIFSGLWLVLYRLRNRLILLLLEGSLLATLDLSAELILLTLKLTVVAGTTEVVANRGLLRAALAALVSAIFSLAFRNRLTEMPVTRLDHALAVVFADGEEALLLTKLRAHVPGLDLLFFEFG